MKYLHPVAAVPNALIDDTKLHYTTKRVALALLLIVPCLFLTGFENVHKAFFYGTGQTFAPTVSETLEMLCRIVGALVLFSLARGVVTLSDGQAAALIVCGMILSELVSATFLTTLYRFRRRKLKGRDTVPLAKILGWRCRCRWRRCWGG